VRWTLFPITSSEEIIMSLQDRLDAFKANFEASGPPYHAPAWIHETMRRATNELIASDAARHALKLGDKAPEFTLSDALGTSVSSAALLAAGPLVVTFYRGVWCPYCNLELQALESAVTELRRRGAQLVAISPQTHANSRRSERENQLSFPILSDPRNETAAAFGLRFTMPDYLIDLYKNTFKNDLHVVNGDDSWTLPMPARYVIAPDRTILYAEVNADYTHRPDPAALLPALDRHRAVAA
jgi:peroxiredoxin